MNNFSTNKKYKRPKQKTQSTTNPESSRQAVVNENKGAEIPCPLAAKDSEWVDILQTPSESVTTTNCVSDEEEVLQLVECEDGPQMKPLAIMFPGLLEKDRNTLEGVLNKVMSTTEVTKHLVDLGQKANFTFMKKADRLIPRDKQWLERLTENSNSYTSMASALFNSSVSSDGNPVNEVTFKLGDEYDDDGINMENESTAEVNRSPGGINTSADEMMTEKTLSEIDQINATKSQTRIHENNQNVNLN